MKRVVRRSPSRILSLAAAPAALIALACLCSPGRDGTPVTPSATEIVVEPTVETADTATPEPPPPTEVVETGSGFEVLRLDDSVWATTDDARPEDLLPIAGDERQRLAGMNWVAAGEDGQALLTGPGCEAAYVYQNSGLTLSGCPAGGGTGMCSTGTLLLSNCDISVSTLSAEVRMSGTWVSVSYLPETQVTLVIVGEGDVSVEPVTGLVFDLLDPDLFLYAVDTRDFGEPVPIGGVDRSEPLFLYTAGNDRLEELGLGDQARAWFGMDALPPVTNVLSPQEPLLDLWLVLIAGQAEADGVNVPGPLTLVSIVEGEPQPHLARSWEAAEDGLSWTIFLDDVQADAGETFYTAGLVAEILSQKQNAPTKITGFVGIEVIDEFTFVVFLSEPNPDFLLELAAIAFPQ